MVAKTISVRAFWELADGSYVSWRNLLGNHDAQRQLVDKRGFKRAIGKMKRAGVIQEV
jgi:hypothetical protein